jgi:hypothetical protein
MRKLAAGVVLGMTAVLSWGAPAEAESPAAKPVEAPAQASSASNGSNEPAAGAGDKTDHNDPRNAGYVTVGAGGLLLAVGVVFRFAAFAEQGKIDAHCNGQRFCDDTGINAVTAARDLQSGSNLFLALGLVATGTGLVLVLANPNKRAASAVLSAAALPGGSGVAVAGSF